MLRRFGRLSVTLFWDGRDDNGLPVASGVYFYYLKAGRLEALKKLVVRR